MAISKEQWQQIAEELNHPHGRVELKCGDDIVTFSVQLVTKLKFGIVTYVNFVWCGAWLKKDSDVGQRFLYKREKYIFSLKYRESYIKAFGGKRCPKAHRDYAETKHVFHDIVWPSVRLLYRHYTKAHPAAELVSVGYVDKSAALPPVV